MIVLCKSTFIILFCMINAVLDNRKSWYAKHYCVN